MRGLIGIAITAVLIMGFGAVAQAGLETKDSGIRGISDEYGVVKYSWKITIVNDTPASTEGRALLQIFDKDGFEIGSAAIYFEIASGQTKTVTDQRAMKSSVWQQAAGYEINVEVR